MATRPRFSDESDIRRRAREKADTMEGSLARWWSKKHKLPPNHPLFQTQTLEDLLLEFYGDLWAEKSQLEAGLSSAEPGERMAIEDRLRELAKVFGENPDFGDPLVAYWEEQEARGEVPDLDMTMADLRRIKGW